MIRRLVDSDVEGLSALRREALLAAPSAFSASPESDVAADPERLSANLGRTDLHGLFGAFDGELVGIAGVHRRRREKQAHRAELSGMYVRPSHRGRGLGAGLLAACVELARSWGGLTHLGLAVSADAEAAIHLYRTRGFESWGSEPAGLSIDGRPLTLHHMVLRLEGPGEPGRGPIERLDDGVVVVRRYRPSDAEPLRRAALESVREAGPWLTWCHAELSTDDCRRWLEGQTGSWERREEFEFAIEDAADGRYLGGCGLNGLQRGHRLANLGFWVRTTATGHGVAPAAARLVARFGFEELGLLRIELVVAVANVRSRRVAEKAGALEEGILRNRLLLHGRSHDAVVFSLIPPGGST